MGGSGGEWGRGGCLAQYDAAWSQEPRSIILRGASPTKFLGVGEAVFLCVIYLGGIGYKKFDKNLKYIGKNSVIFFTFYKDKYFLNLGQRRGKPKNYFCKHIF